MRLGTRRLDAGFTLVELMVTVVIIAVLASIALVAFINALDKAKQRSTMADMRTVAQAIETYMVDQNVPPDDSGGLASLVGVLTPYHTTVLPTSDHWNHSYNYASDPTGEFTLESFGKDGLDGADITIATRSNFNLDIVVRNGIFVAAPE